MSKQTLSFPNSSFSFKPQLKTLGPKFGKQLGEIRNILSSLDGNDAMDEINETGTLKINLSTGEAVLEKEDLLIETAQAEGYESLSDKGITVALSTTLTPELIEEGFVREIISKIQTMRKDSGFEVMDNIILYCKDNDNIKAVIEKNAEEIKEEVLAKEIIFDGDFAEYKEWNLNGEDVALGVKKE